MRNYFLATILTLTTTCNIFALPIVSLVSTGTTNQTSASINQGTANFTLDLRLNTDGAPVSGFQFFLTTSGPTSVFYSSTVSLLGNPFVSGDISSVPAATAPVNNTSQFAFFKSSSPDYAPIGASAIGNVATFTFNTSGFAANTTYTFSPIGVELSNSNDVFEQFGSPGTFILTVVPEPSTYALIALGTILMGGIAWRRKIVCL